MLYFVMIARTGGIIMSVTIREPGSAITHFIGMMMAIIASTPLLIKAVLSNQPVVFIAMIVFIASMILLYGASATYPVSYTHLTLPTTSRV